MKKVLSTAVLCALLTLSFFFAGCKNSVSSGGNFNPQNTPLTLEAIADGEIIFDNLDRITGLKYKINDNDSVEITETSGSKSIPVSAGDVVSIYANGTSNNNSYFININCSSDCYIYGNVMSLLTDNFQNETKISQKYAFTGLFYNNTHIKNHSEKKFILPATILADKCYGGMFLKCTSLTTTPDLPATILKDGCYQAMFASCTKLTKAPILPSTTLAEYCYSSMFYGCSSLTKAPNLPATTLAKYCYSEMFDSCTNLTKAPDLPATSLADYCYYTMFSNCTSLTTSPILPATILTQNCYNQMFIGCSSLKQVECLATDISADSCTSRWLSGVASSGTFIKAAGTDWSTGFDGIPSGWTIQKK